MDPSLCRVGRLMSEVREKRGLTQERVAYGLCSKGHYSKIENQEIEPDKSVLEVFFERMGLCINKFGQIYTLEEYLLEEQKNRVLLCLKEADPTGAREEWEICRKQAEETQMEEICRKIQMQFLQYAGLAVRMEEGSREDLEAELLETLRITIPAFREDRFSEYLYGRQELAVLILLAENRYRRGRKEESICLYQKLMAYMEAFITDEEERNILYPETVAALAEKLAENGRYEELVVCEKGLALLRENHRMNGMEKLLYYTLQSAGPDDGETSDRQNRKLYGETITLLQELQEKYGGQRRVGVYPLLQVVLRGQVLGERIRRARKSRGLSVEQLSELADCSSKTLEKIERGETRPTSKTYRALMRALEMDEQRIYPFIHSDSYEMHETVKHLEKWLVRLNYRRVEEELEKLEEGLDQEDAVNRQLLLKNRAVVDAQAGRISRAEEQELLWQAFYLTVPEGLEDISFWPLDQTEAQILNHIALSLNEEGRRKEAISLLRKAKRRYEFPGEKLGRVRPDTREKSFPEQRSYYREHGMSLEYNAIPYLLVTGNLINFTGSEGNYEEALQLAEEILPLAWKRMKVNTIANLLYEIAWNMEQLIKRDGQDTMFIYGKCLELFHQSYLLNMISDQKVRAEFVKTRCENYYRVTWED